jgi:hypothetical protein
MRKTILKLITEGLSYREISHKLGCSKSTISYHASKGGLPKSIRRKINWPIIRTYYESGKSIRECLKHFAIFYKSWAAAVQRGDIVLRPYAQERKPLTMLLVKKKVISDHHLKKRLIVEGLLKQECYKCKITSWCGLPLTLQLDHVDGDGTNNELINLRLLCPNCHTQTPTYGSKSPKWKNSFFNRATNV